MPKIYKIFINRLLNYTFIGLIFLVFIYQFDQFNVFIDAVYMYNPS